MLAMGRALMAAPRLLLLDEPSLGLAPLITDEIFSIIHQLARAGTTIFIVEQNAARALSASDTAYLLAGGSIVEQGKSRDLLLDPSLRAAFLGAASHDNPSASRLGAAGLTNIRLEKPPMHKNFMPSFNSTEELKAHQLKGLQWTVRHAFEGSPAYRAKLEAAGVTPDSIQSLDDLKRLPFTTTDDLRDGYPFPLKSVPFEQLVRVHASSGTTGKRKVLCYTQKDLDDWTDMFARCYQSAGVNSLDRVQIAVGYGVWTAGMGFQLGCEKVGALAVKDKRILATGYNGAPAGLAHCLDLGCMREKLGIPSGQRHELCRALHAEQNVIIQAAIHQQAEDSKPISPKVLLALMEAEQGALSTCPDPDALANLMGLEGFTTAEGQINEAARLLGDSLDAYSQTDITPNGWQTGVAKLTLDNVSVTPANDTLTVLFDVLQNAGAFWGGDQPDENGVQGIYRAYLDFNLFVSLPKGIFTQYLPLAFSVR